MPKDKTLVKTINGTPCKRCSVCRDYKPFDSFYKDCNKNSSTGLRPECIPCRQKREHGYYYADKSKTRRRIRKYLYGISNEEFEQMWSQQSGKCDMCKAEMTKEYGHKRNTCHIDHCHSTGKVRGLLCLQCNSLLGMARDNKSILLNAINYLEKYE